MMEVNTIPVMDRLTHAVLKETSKNLKYYIDVKRRENAFILNPNSQYDCLPLRARSIYGTTKEYPPLYGSCFSDNDVKSHLRTWKPQRLASKNAAEKKMCREELNFHMKAYNFMPSESPKFADLRLRPLRSNSSCSLNSSCVNNRDIMRMLPNAGSKLTRIEQNQLVDDTANILATMVKSRRAYYEASLSQKDNPVINQTNLNDISGQHKETVGSLRTETPPADKYSITRKENKNKKKRVTENILAKAASIMRNATRITKGYLCEYKISITTGSCNGASTDGPIRIMLYGTNGTSGFINLSQSDSHRVPFLKGQTDIFPVKTYYVGELVGITIGHDRKDMRSSWYLGEVTIDDPVRFMTYYIPCNGWLSSKSVDQKTYRDFQVSNIISHMRKTDENGHSARRRTETEDGENSSVSSYKSVSTSSTTSTDHDSVRVTEKTRRRSSVAKMVNDQQPSQTNSGNQVSSTNVETYSGHDNTLESQFRTDIRQRSPSISADSTSSVSERTVTPIQTTATAAGPSKIEIELNSNILLSKRRSIENIPVTPTTPPRPPARLEKRESSISSVPQTPSETKQQSRLSTTMNKITTSKNDDDVLGFFD